MRNLHSTRSRERARCFKAVRAWGWVALLGAACSAADDAPTSPTAAPSSAQPPAGSAAESPAPENAGAPLPEDVTTGATPGASAPADSSGAAAETPEVSALEPSAGEEMNGAGAQAPIAPADGEEAGAPEPSDPTSDENLRFILEDGFQTTYFAIHCSATGEDGTEIDGDSVTELPVGGGYILECELDRLPSRSATDVLSAADEPWCALGELRSFATGGDERLSIVLSSPPDSPSPTLVATRRGEPITVQQASAFGALLWPVWLVTSYDAVDLARAEPGKICDEVFEL